MADEATGAIAESPAGSAQEPSSPFAEARAELATLGTEESTTPAAKAPDSQADDATAETETDAGTEGDSSKSQPEGSRRERGKQLEAQIEQRVRADLLREQEEARAKEQAEQATNRDSKAYRDLVARAKAGDWEAVQQHIALSEGGAFIKDGAVVEAQPQEVAEVAHARGRNAVIAELTKDFASINGTLDGATADDYASLEKAPSIADYGKRAFEIGRRPVAELQARVTTLETENQSLRGRLTGATPSPMPANGARTGGAPQATGFSRFAEMAKAELEARA